MLDGGGLDHAENAAQFMSSICAVGKSTDNAQCRKHSILKDRPLIKTGASSIVLEMQIDATILITPSRWVRQC